MSKLSENFIPNVLQCRGLHDAHPRPLAANGKTPDGAILPKRTDPATAWQMPYIEINPANSVSVIVMDCDDYDAYARFWYNHARYPKPTYSIRNRSNDHVQAGWVMQSPVQRNDPPRRYPTPCPQRWLAQVVGRMTNALGADTSYNNVLARNPTYRDDTLETHWTRSRTKGYTLDQLGNNLPNVPNERLVDNGYGRNVTLFDSLMSFAGKPEHQTIDLLPQAMTINARFDHQLPLNEVRATTKSVTRYRRYFRYYDHSWQSQIARGRKSGIARQTANAERDAQICEMYRSGNGIRAIGRELDLSVSAVRHVLKRDCKAYQWKRRGRSMRVPNDRDANIVMLNEKGSFSLREIAEAVGCSHETVRTVLASQTVK